MSNTKFYITSHINNNVEPEELRKTLFKNNIFTKFCQKTNRMLLYTKYNEIETVKNELERECRSMVIDVKTRKVICNTGDNPRLNKEGTEYLLANSTNPRTQTVCYEGTGLAIYYHGSSEEKEEGQWFVSTRRCLDCSDSVYNPSGLDKSFSHYDMLLDALSLAYPTVKRELVFNHFTEKLDKSKSYYVVLIHHLNKLLINYDKAFGKDYARLCLTSVRNEDMSEVDIYSDKIEFASYSKDGIIFVPEQLASIANMSIDYESELCDEGIIVHIFNEERNKFDTIKLQSINYQFAKVIGPEQNIIKGFVYLYQNNKLVEYFNSNNQAVNFRQMSNPHDETKIYDIIGVIDSVFKVCTSELFELFKLLWSLKDGKHLNVELYNMLPKEYKDVLYGIRGLYYKKKAAIVMKNNDALNINDIKKSHLKINDIYNYLKSLPTEVVLSFLRMRRLMFNWVISEHQNKNLSDFGKINSFCDKVNLKLCAIFTARLYPNIMSNDIPPQKLPVVTETSNEVIKA
jgi:hypothetical protein